MHVLLLSMHQTYTLGICLLVRVFLFVLSARRESANHPPVFRQPVQSGTEEGRSILSSNPKYRCHIPGSCAFLSSASVIRGHRAQSRFVETAYKLLLYFMLLTKSSVFMSAYQSGPDFMIAHQALLQQMKAQMKAGIMLMLLAKSWMTPVMTMNLQVRNMPSHFRVATCLQQFVS